MMRIRRITGEGWRKLKCPVLSKSSLSGKAKKLRVSRQMLKIYVGCFITLLANSFSITMLFPFLPFMVQFLLPELKEDKESIGKYAGIIAAFMFLGRFFGSYVWGAVADKKGRKPVIIASCLLLGLFSAAFGFSVHFAMAVILRFGVGLMNGVLGTTKAVISETSDDSNQAFGIGVVSCAWGMGLIIGPAVSGAIADPIGQYNLTVSNAAVHGFLTKFPYSIPCILNFVLSLLGVVATVCLIPETLGMKKNKKRDEELDEEDSNEQGTSSSSEDIAESTSNEETDNTAVDTGNGSHCSDVDLGTLGRRPFAMREDDTTGSKTASFSVTLEPISETSGSDTVPPLTSVQRESTSSSELQASPQDERQVVFHCGAGSSSRAVDKSSNGRDECTSSGGVGVRTKSVNQSDLGGGIPTNLSTGQEVCSGEIEEVDLGMIGSGDTRETDTGTARAETRKECTGTRTHKSSPKERRRSSFLIPFFNRSDSFTVSFVKPSQSALRRKAARKALRRKLEASEGAIQQADVTSEESQQEEIEVPEDLSGGDSDRERLLEDTVEEEELSRTRRVLKRVGQSIKLSLFDLRLFLCTRTPFLAISIYCTFSFGVIGFEEIYSVWAATPPYLGGLGFTLHDIGISMAITGVFLLPFTLIMFPVLEKYFGAIKTFYISCIPLMVTMILLPNLHYLVGQRVLLWFLLILMVLLIRISFIICFGCSILFINNSVTFDKLGAINGLSVSLTALFRTVAPLFSGGIFSASLSETTRAIGFPLDSHLIFLIFGAVFLGTVFIVACLPQSINRQKIVD